MVSSLDKDLQVLEIGFMLNARHGLRLVDEFGVKVSVELSTELSHDVEGSLFYGRRFAALSSNFIVKIPMTPAGLIAAKQLASEGIPINFTLGFSARHNHLAAGFAKPNWVNVFLGRIGAYVSDNGLGSAEGVGEKAMLASQRTLRELATGTKQIAASMRNGEQAQSLFEACDHSPGRRHGIH